MTIPPLINERGEEVYTQEDIAKLFATDLPPTEDEDANLIAQVKGRVEDIRSEFTDRNAETY